jgi:transposase
MAQRDSDPGAMLMDKGYDSDPIRQDLRDRGTAPEIPTKRNRKVQHSVGKRLYALRSRIECFIGHLKEQRSIATRYDKTASSFRGSEAIASRIATNPGFSASASSSAAVPTGLCGPRAQVRAQPGPPLAPSPTATP